MTTAQRHGQTPTLREINSDELTKLSRLYWVPGPEKTKPFDAQIIEDIYYKELQNLNTPRVMLLELSHYLEDYLWPSYHPENSTFAHTMSIVIMINEKFRENVRAWGCFHQREQIFPQFFDRVLQLFASEKNTIKEKTYLIIFLINCFQSFEDSLVRKLCLRLVGLPIWSSVNPERVKLELKGKPKLERLWAKYLSENSDAGQDESSKGKKRSREEDNKPNKKSKSGSPQSTLESNFLVSLVQDYLKTLDSLTDLTDVNTISYCERFIEFMNDLMSQLPTRRMFQLVLEDTHLVVRSRLSYLYSQPEGSLFRQLLEMLKFYQGFEINNFTGLPLTTQDMTSLHYNRIQNLQIVAFKFFQPELRDFALSNISAIEPIEKLKHHFSQLSDEKLHQINEYLCLLPKKVQNETREFLTEILVSAHQKRISQIEAVNDFPLYPSEVLLWDLNVIPSQNYNGEGCLALPKLNLQFLTFHDYLLRNFNLFRLESTYEIREDIEDAVRRVMARKTSDGHTEFTGWARMALPIKDFKIKHVSKPILGENKPNQVRAEVTINLATTRGVIRTEWEGLKVHDIVFLLSIKAPISQGEKLNTSLPFRKQFGLVFVRGGEVEEVLDETGKVLDERSYNSDRTGTRRTYRLLLDSNQYQQDLALQAEKGVDVYKTFNLLMRRKPKENNFKAILETIRDLMNSNCAVPDWLHDVFLGYGNPNAAQNINQIQTLNFNDTFLDVEHVKESFPDKEIVVQQKGGEKVERPFRLTFPATQPNQIILEPFVSSQHSFQPKTNRKQNRIRFTPVQTKAIKSGMNEGLTLVVGPPGTGKTDVAVQIISNWYHNFPEQRTLLVTHSNQALNQLFEKLMALDINERHLLRLGHGQEMLETEKDFSKFGRVNYMLNRRLELLSEVDSLAKSIEVNDDVGYTTETATNFFHHIQTLWHKFKQSLSDKNAATGDIKSKFPFNNYFEHKLGEGEVLFKGVYAEDKEIAEKSWEKVKALFSELKEIRPFELLISSYDRTNYLLIKQARIIAMTCTHAALKRRDLVAVGFKYDNLLMEEAAQILEIETFIPLLLQNQNEEEQCRLKRAVLIGDHNQLPPVVKNLAFQKYSHLDQSLFARFVRLGVPTIDLDYQGRSRSTIASLYNWKYKDLGNLSCVNSNEYLLANSGFLYDYQMINVEDYEGRGETEPNPYFYQNLGEAEYIVAVYQYMRLLGYPAEKISIITTYNGQKHLIRDVIDQKCSRVPLFGKPHKITTVDRFQGQQNDYILLSLVRTKSVGHIRDTRRLVVAMSRARLGLFVFCRRALFENCFELTDCFNLLTQRPDKLVLVPNESFPTNRQRDENPATTLEVNDVLHMSQVVRGTLQTQIGTAPSPMSLEPTSSTEATPMVEDA
eukprot:TRINITY_DN1262_c0_g2_i1.p1 TRINITY_DN1262_c0_g2~~TRINITY_DN1262_c0_g2_i1.p1  ORF type:complete len:1382 (+),score=283.84 TRINITY_DN1262_c0_g2_i1:49-4194(+)